MHFTKIQPQSFGSVQLQPKSSSFFPGNFSGSQPVSEAPKTSFSQVMGNLISDTDKTLAKPDELMNRALTTGDVDIHEIMVANTKADLAVNIASQVATKIIQAYERVQQIQV